MKNIKKFGACLLALCFTAPTLLTACKTQSDSTDNGESSLPPVSSSESVLDSPLDSAPPAEESAPQPAPPVEEPPAPPVKQKAQYMKCTGDRVNLRTGAGTDFAVLGSAEEGTMYAIIGKTGNCYKTY
jgi:uncharacterized protein YgiM (DUF1202 family)